MPERFEAVIRDRYGVSKGCVKDHVTGGLAIFTGDTEAFAAELNADPESATKYVWSREIGTPAATPEGNKE
jgi:hypothetical protein